MSDAPVIHRVQARAFPVNAYLIEGKEGVVLVDSTLTVSDGRMIRAKIAELGKPLTGAVVTHAHPDHYGALVEVVGDARIPIFAVAGVADAIRRDDPEKERILRPMFGDEWPTTRIFPNHVVADGEPVTCGEVRLTPVDLGPGESPHDSLWVVDGPTETAFVGDLVYNHMHAYLADGHHAHWLENIERVRGMFGAKATFYPGHGEPASPALLEWQATYIRAFLGAVRDAQHSATPDAKVQQVTERMKQMLPSDDLLFLMQLSVPAMSPSAAEAASASSAR